MRPPGAFSGGDALAFARMIAPFGGGAVSVLAMTNHGFFGDESCTHRSAHATVVAGYLAAERHWQLYGKTCRRLHRKAQLKAPFHSTDFVKPGHEDYAHLSPREKGTLIRGLEGAICDAPRTGFIVAVVNADYEAVFPHDLKRRLRHPYLFCTQALIKILASWAPTKLPRGDKIYCVFEKQKGMEDRVRALYREIATPVHDPHEYLLSDCAVVEKREATQLVAADILANCAGRFVKRPGLSMAKRDDPTLFRLLSNKQLEHRWKYYDRGELEELRDSMLARGILPLKKGPR